MASLKELAAELGVSHTLVSRVLNNRMGTARVGVKTREAILRRAREMDYRPNPLAVALKRGRKGAVGVFIHQVGVEGSDLSLRFLEAASSALAKERLNLWLQFFKSEKEFLAACNQRLTHSIDGLIIAGIGHPELAETLAQLEENGMPIICTSETEDMPLGFTTIRPDQARHNYLTTRHLIETGCRRIAHFDTIPLRRAGYLQALAEANIEPDPELIIRDKGFTADTGAMLTAKLLESGIKFDAINAQSDAQGAGAMRYLSEIGLPQSEWPKITGVDDSPIAHSYSIVPLTTTTSCLPQCAELAVSALLKKLNGEPTESLVVTPRLVVRESTLGEVKFSQSLRPVTSGLKKPRSVQNTAGRTCI
ncbi:MAG: LacI family DNA-binding transcriptional regulator [Candidatus Methylacidiphilales bacterium]|nr:LacI family DNA-binding transcriptional regulator [Candidatus Methylacidiphilales bacterium]